MGVWHMATRAKGRRGPATPKARPKPQARATAEARAAAETPAEVAATPAGSPDPAGRRPAALRLAAAGQLVEAAGLCVAGVFAAVSTAAGRSHQLASGLVLTVIAFGTAAALAYIAAALVKAEPWSRIPVAMTQLFVVIGGVTLLDGHRPEWGVPALVLAGVCVAGLLTPASLRALNRPPVKSP